jgi:hypothetical protein
MASRPEPRRISGRYIVYFLVVFAVLCAASRSLPASGRAHRSAKSRFLNASRPA